MKESKPDLIKVKRGDTYVIRWNSGGHESIVGEVPRQRGERDDEFAARAEKALREERLSRRLTFEGRISETKSEILSMKRFSEIILESTEYPECEILSVKRISDGDIFTVGDEIDHVIGDYRRTIGKITKIWKSFEQTRIDIDRLGLVLSDEIQHTK